MELRCARAESGLHVELRAPQGWISVTKTLTRMGISDTAEARRWGSDIVALLGAEPELRARLVDDRSRHGA